MKQFFLACLLLVAGRTAFAQDDSARLVLRKMHDTYAGKWYKTLHFVQETKVWKNDSLQKTDTWIESIEFPDKFRIDFGDTEKGDLVIFRNDSVYRIVDWQVKRSRKEANFLLFQLGGMYFHPFDTLPVRFAREGFDLTRFHSDVWNGRPVYVIGAEAGDDSTKQLWVDKAHLYAVRSVTPSPEGKEEALFSRHIRLDGGWCETQITFRIANGFRQGETYSDCTANEKFDPRLFDPKRCKEWHWYKSRKKKKDGSKKR